MKKTKINDSIIQTLFADSLEDDSRHRLAVFNLTLVLEHTDQVPLSTLMAVKVFDVDPNSRAARLAACIGHN